jgi:hypothetical protein
MENKDDIIKFINECTQSNLKILEQMLHSGFDLGEHYDIIINNIITTEDHNLGSVLDWLDTIADLDYAKIFDLALSVSAYSTTKWVAISGLLDKDRMFDKVVACNSFELLNKVFGFQYVIDNANEILVAVVCAPNVCYEIIFGLCRVKISHEFNNDALDLILSSTHDYFTVEDFSKTGDEDKIVVIRHFVETLRCDPDIWHKWIGQHESPTINLYLFRTKYNISDSDLKFVESMLRVYVCETM